MSLIPVRRVLISVSDKEGLAPLAAAFSRLGATIFATRGSQSFLTQSCKVESTPIESLTEVPELVGGRVKTLHPRVFAGILRRDENPEDARDLVEHGIPTFDVVVVNLYPFAQYVDHSWEEQIEHVDIGGPALIRAAAKNHSAVAILSDPSDYAFFLDELERKHGSTSLACRRELAVRAFSRTSTYDLRIASTWRGIKNFPAFPSFEHMKSLRYGENPHQAGFWLSDREPEWTCLQGKELSYNNLLDAHVAAGLARAFTDPAVTVVKHNTPSGAASSREASVLTLATRAIQADAESAFGGIVAFNRPVDGETAEYLSQLFLEVILAPAYDDEAMHVFSRKKNLRVVQFSGKLERPWDLRTALGGILVQTTDPATSAGPRKCVTRIPCDPKFIPDLEFAFKVAQFARSNAVVLAEGGITLAIGAGQTSRVEAVRQVVRKAESLGRAMHNAVLASDAFFPFRDNIDRLAPLGIRAILQPGGSVRDNEVIQACDEHGIAMLFSGERHFRH